jgi:hypothetical protein
MSDVSYLALTSISKMMQNRLEKHCTQVDIQPLADAHSAYANDCTPETFHAFEIEAEFLSYELENIANGVDK